MLAIRSARETDADPIRSLIYDVLGEYGLEPDRDGTDRDLEDMPGFYTRNGGTFEVLVNSGGNIVGTVGLYLMDEYRCELRKMYFAPVIRGQGWGKSVLDRAIRKAQDLGFSEMRLETASVLIEAIGLYQSFGFEELPADPHEPRCDRTFAMTLNDYEPATGCRELKEEA